MPKIGITARLMVEAVELLSNSSDVPRDALERAVSAVSQAIAGRDVSADELAVIEAEGLPAFLRLVKRLDLEQLGQLERPA